MKLNEYIVLDIETTGLSKNRHKITELAALKVKDNQIVSRFQSLVNPKVPIPRFITRLTGINNEMVKNAKPIEAILPTFLNFIGKDIIVAHNASFDYGFISYNAKAHLNVYFDNEKICTRKLANRLLSELPSKSLSYLCQHMKIINSDAHRAMGDCLATSKIFKKFLTQLYSNGITKKDHILSFEKLPIENCRKMIC